MNTIYLHGQLREMFGPSFDLEVRDAREAVRALCSQLEGFQKVIQEGTWRVIRGPKESGHELDVDALDLSLGSQPLHIIPVAEGAGDDGVGKVIVGAIMIAAAVYTGGTTLGFALGAMGAGLVMAGAAIMLAPTPEDPEYEGKEKDTQSFLFNGPVNVNKQGVAVPLVYGQTITGSVVVSAGIRAKDIPVDGDYSGVTGNTGKVEGK